VLAVKEINRGVDCQAGVLALPTDTASKEEIIAAGGMGVVT